MKNNKNNAVYVWTANGNIYIFSSRDDAQDYIDLLIEEYGEKSPYADAMIVDPYDRR